MEINRMKQMVLSGVMLDKEALTALADCDLGSLIKAADEIRMEKCGRRFELCTIINGRSGRCTEDCKYCAQSACYSAKVTEYDLLEQRVIKLSALSNEKDGVHRFSIVTSGRTLEDGQLEALCGIYGHLGRMCNMGLCASHGLLTFEQLVRLKAAGVRRYHNNLETSRNYFPRVCSTHTYDDKIKTIQAAKKAGLEVCSGGIIGMGESMEDRIDMAITLRDINVNSVPLNVLNPIQGTPLYGITAITEQEMLRTFAVYRFALPDTQIRLAGGRSLIKDKGQRAFGGGINAAISGEMLTTSGIGTKDDIAMVLALGYEVAYE